MEVRLDANSMLDSTPQFACVISNGTFLQVVSGCIHNAYACTYVRMCV